MQRPALGLGGAPLPPFGLTCLRKRPSSSLRSSAPLSLPRSRSPLLCVSATPPSSPPLSVQCAASLESAQLTCASAELLQDSTCPLQRYVSCTYPSPSASLSLCLPASSGASLAFTPCDASTSHRLWASAASASSRAAEQLHLVSRRCAWPSCFPFSTFQSSASRSHLSLPSDLPQNVSLCRRWRSVSSLGRSSRVARLPAAPRFFSAVSHPVLTLTERAPSAQHTTNRQSWPVHLEALREVIAKAEFIALDVELTGLHVKHEKYLGVERCYEAHCEGARNFLPVQLGLCAARRASPAEPHRWILTPASVYMFPREARLFQASTATLTFLRENGFDFNEWLDQGIPFLRAQEEKEKRQALQTRIDDLDHLIQTRGKGTAARDAPEGSAASPSLLETASPEDSELAASVRASIREWLASKRREPLHLPVESPLHRLLLHSLVASEFPSLYSLSVKLGDRRVLAIYQSEEEVYEEQRRGLLEDIQRVEELRGVRQLLDDVSDHKLVVIGHNCFYDFLHIFQTLYADLPQSLSEFKTTWTHLFSSTFDTKLIAESHDALAPLQPPATLKGLCDFMAALAAATMQSADSKGRREERDASASPLGAPESLEFQLELLPGTKWTLPPALQPLAVPPISLSALLSEPAPGDPSASPPKLSSSSALEESSEGAATDEAAGMSEERAGRSVVAAAGSGVQQVMQGEEGKEGGAARCSKEPEEEDYSHDAGYDSMMTSAVFLLQLAHVLPRHGLKWENLQFRTDGATGRTLGVRRQGLLAALGSPKKLASEESRASRGRNAEPDKRATSKTPSHGLSASEELQARMDAAAKRKGIADLLPLFVNRIRLSRSQPSSINLGGQDEQLQQQKRLLLMRNHPTHWKKWELMKIWSPVWVDVQPVDNSTSWIVVRDEEDMQNILTIYEMLREPEFELLNYDQYRALQQQQQRS